MTYRGKRRDVVEVLEQTRERGAYQFRVRFSCGHPGKIRNARTTTGYRPTIGYCNHPECIMASGVCA